MNRLELVYVHGGRSDGRWRRDRALLLALLGALASLSIAAFPPAAGAFAPFLGPVSATPTESGATLKATIYPYGLDTHYRFEYGATNAYGSSAPVPEGDAGSAPYPGTSQAQATITGLAANTTYHFRVVATNVDGPATSSDAQFTTTGVAPTVSDEAALEVSGGFELKGTVNPNGSATNYQFEYGTTTSYGSKIPLSQASVGAGSADVAVAQTVTGLLPNTTYHFRLVAHSGANTAATGDRTFLTPPAPPSAPTAEVNAPQATAGGYELKGAVNPNSLATAYHFEFGMTTSYGQNLPEPDESVGSGQSAVPVMQEITGLLPSTTYHYRIAATNAEGTSHSLDQSFTTSPPKPTVTSLPVTEDGEGFTLHGSVNPNGAATTYFFEFGVTEAYGQSIPSSAVGIGSGSSPVSVSQLVKGLPPNVPYHYRLVAHNAGGTSIGEDQAFVTPAEPEETRAGESPSTVLSVPKLTLPSSSFSTRTGTVRAGRAVLSVVVPGPGTVSASGRWVKAARASASGAGTVALAVKLTIVFQPIGGNASSTHKTVVFR